MAAAENMLEFEEPASYKEERRSVHSKKKYKRNVSNSLIFWTGDGAIAKVILLEGPLREHSKEELAPILAYFNNDGTGLNCYVPYSLKKKKRHFLLDDIDSNLPNLDITFSEFLYPLESISINRIVSKRNDVQSPGISFARWRYAHDMRKSNGKTKELTVKKGADVQKYSGSLTSDYEFLVSEEKSQSGKVHLQYQIIEYDGTARNSKSISEECRCRRCRTRGPSVFEQYCLGKDYPTTGYLLKRKEKEEELSEEENVSPVPTRCQQTFNLDEIPLRVEKRRGKTYGYHDWVFT